MLPLTSILAFGAVSAAIIVTPGPSVMFVVSRALAFGRRVGLLTVLGNTGGLILQILVVAAGLATLLERSIAAYTVVRFAGAIYLVWLGVQAIRSRSTLTNAADDVEPMQTTAILREGFIVGTFNPKSLALFAAFMPQFIPADSASPFLNTLLLGGVFVLVAVVLDSMWALGAGTARAWFANSPQRLATMKTISGATMIALGLNLAVDPS